MVIAGIFSCDSYRVGRLVQSSRQALLKKDFEAALSHFEKAAKKDPRYIFAAPHFKEGIWTYVGRTQYATGRYAQARQSHGLALSTHEQDRLARLYLGLVLLRGGSELQGLAELRTGMQDLHDWIDYIV